MAGDSPLLWGQPPDSRVRRAHASSPPPPPDPPLPCTAPRSAERFGTQYRDPGRRREFQLEARKERLAGEGFATGIDLFSEVRRLRTGELTGGAGCAPAASCCRVGCGLSAWCQQSPPSPHSVVHASSGGRPPRLHGASGPS
jgi:hypothetical protein